MKIYYVGSFDPPHIGHLNTYKKACAKLDSPIGIAICSNELKTTPLLNLEERARLCKMIFDTEDVVICQNSDEIKRFASECDIFVRGYRDQSDERYIQLLADYYKLENIFERVIYIPIDDEFLDVSSSKIRELINNRADYQKYLPSAVFEYLSKDKS